MQIEIVRSSPYANGSFVILPTQCVFAKISPFAFRLYCAYCTYANNQRKAWPSRKTLASALHRTVDTIDRANLELETGGWIRVQSQDRENGSQTVNIITLLDPFLQNLEVLEIDRKNSAPPAANMRPQELNPLEHKEIDIDTNVSISTKRRRGRPARARKTEGIDQLFIAFRSKRFPNAVPERFNPAELAANQTVLSRIYEGGITPEQFAYATEQAMLRFDSAAMVTVRSVARNLTSLVEPVSQRRQLLTNADRRAEDARRFSEDRLMREYEFFQQQKMEAIDGESD